MVEATLLPDGTVLWVNGGNRGAQGFGLMSNPTFEALLYDPAKPLGQRWTTCGTTTIPRLYHSVALLMPDATVLIAGSNPVQMPVLETSNSVPYATEFRVERFTPPYLLGPTTRPSNVQLASGTIRADGSTFQLSFLAGVTNVQVGSIKIMLYHCGYVTHSLHMGHRMVQLDIVSGFVVGSNSQTIVVTGPPTNNIAPPGPYWVYVVVNGIPAIGVPVQVI